MSDAPARNRAVPYDPHNDQFVRPLTCPQPGCGAPANVSDDDDDALALCAACNKPFEVVHVPVGTGAGEMTIPVTRRARIMTCTTTGQRITRTSLLDWAGAGGSPSRGGALPDRRGLVFGEPTRDIEWDLEAGWSQSSWGQQDSARGDEVVTSVSVFRGVVVAVSAQGLVGLFDVDDGRPLLDHPLTWPGVDIDDDDHARAVRLAPAFQGSTMVVVTDHTALFRDLSSSLFPQARRQTSRLFVEVAPTAQRQYVGPPLACHDPARVVLAESRVSALDDAAVRFFDLDGRELARVHAPGLVRPPAYDDGSGRIIWVTSLGHVVSVDARNPKAGTRTALPGEMLHLSAGERAHLVVAPDNAGSAELWLADDAGGNVRVWRAPLHKALREDADWSWEVMFEHKDTGSLRGMSVGFGSGDRKNVASQYLVLSTERTTAALSRAMKGSASDAMLVRSPIAPPVLTSVGFLSQDRKGLWLRALPPWSFKDKNPERFLDVGEGRPAFYDRTFALYGRHVFYAHAGRINSAKLVARQARRDDA